MTYQIVEEKIGEDHERILSPLLELHWEEVAKNKELMVLKPDMAKYRTMEDMGIMFCLFAYYEGTIVGYSVVIVQPHMHYSDLICAYNDVIFITKEHRNISLGSQLIKETERISKERGAKLMLWHAKENTALANILPHMGNTIQEIIYSKEL